MLVGSVDCTNGDGIDAVRVAVKVTKFGIKNETTVLRVIILILAKNPKYQLSPAEPPLPVAKTKSEPRPLRPLYMPFKKASATILGGASIACPLSEGPQLQEYI
jgi:hypothetical protein